MTEPIEGSQAVAAAVTRCRPDVISCYPITPQTHIVENLSVRVRKGEIGNCQFINAESEFGALSILIGASAAGARTYTATSSQGLLFMAEAIYNASGLGLPIVMTIGNRAIGAPINIWNDHSDSMSMRDAGWIQIFAETNQEAVDLHIQAFRLAEELSCPVMVCMDGFILTHAYEPVEIPTQEQIDVFLPPYEPVQVLDPADPVTIGAMVGPEAFAEVRYLAHHKQLRALERIPQLSAEFQERFGRVPVGLTDAYRTDDADTIVVALGSVNGTIREAVDELRDGGIKVGSLKIGSYRPFPTAQVRAVLHPAQRAIVVEKDLALGKGGIVSSDVKMALRGLSTIVQTVIAGLGGRSITKASLIRMIGEARAGKLEEPHFLDLNWTVIHQEIERQQRRRRSGPMAEHVLRAVNAIASKIT